MVTSAHLAHLLAVVREVIVQAAVQIRTLQTGPASVSSTKGRGVRAVLRTKVVDRRVEENVVRVAHSHVETAGQHGVSNLCEGKEAYRVMMCSTPTRRNAQAC